MSSSITTFSFANDARTVLKPSGAPISITNGAKPIEELEFIGRKEKTKTPSNEAEVFDSILKSALGR